MKYLTNIYDPKKSDAIEFISCPLDKSLEEEWRNHVLWLKDKIIGKPKGTKVHTAEELTRMGMVGVYAKNHQVC